MRTQQDLQQFTMGVIAGITMIICVFALTSWAVGIKWQPVQIMTDK